VSNHDHIKRSAILLSVTGGTLAMTLLMGLLLWVMGPGPEFVPVTTATLGAVSGLMIGLFQSKAMPLPAPKGLLLATGAGGAIGVPLAIALSFPFTFVLGESALAIGGIVLGLCLGAVQFLTLRRTYARTWPWIVISAAALGAGFLLAIPVTRSLHLGFYPPVSPGWTAMGTVAGLIYGLTTGLVTAYYGPKLRTHAPDMGNPSAA
jgi:hypothetical protein